MKQTPTIPETFLGIGYTKDRGGLPLEAVRVPVLQLAADQALILRPDRQLRPAADRLSPGPADRGVAAGLPNGVIAGALTGLMILLFIGS